MPWITSKTDYGFQIVSLTNNPDLLPPLLLNLSVHSDNMNNSLATVNDRITINLTTDDNLSLNYATIFDRIANVTIYDNILSATMDILQNDSGHVRFNMSVSDEAGNNLTVTDDDLVHSNVFVDTHEPLVLSLDLSSNYQNPSYAISGNKLTLTFKTNERIYDATATILNRPANITITNDTVLATIFVESHDEGFVPFELTVSDLVYT